MKVLDVPQTGSCRDVVASRNRFGPHHRARVTPHHPRTAAQQGVWGSMTDLSWLWNHLTGEQYSAWHELARHVKSRPDAFGNSATLAADQVFKKLNRVLATCRREPLCHPPPLPQFGPNPVEGFEIRLAKSRVIFRLRASSTVSWEARPPLEDLMLFSWAPCNPPVLNPRNWAFVGLLSAPYRGEIDITELYLTKLRAWRRLRDKRYHVPLEGSRVFIRVCQQINGWQNEAMQFVASARVPLAGRSGPGEWPASLPPPLPGNPAH